MINLRETVDRLLERTYQRIFYEDVDFLKQHLTSALKEVYQSTFRKSPKECGDVLVPADETYLKEAPIVSDGSQYFLDYRWNAKKNEKDTPEFSGIVESDVAIEKGALLDRLGDEYGRYMSPLKPNGGVYTVPERALPYLFLANKVENEPSYHRYRVISRITLDAVKTAVEISRLLKPGVLRTLERKLSKGRILYGDVARVDSFGKQGIGGGKQYFTCIAVTYLELLGFLEEA